MAESNTINAFISCSLRQEDRAFVQLVAKVLKSYGLTPFGTIGLFDVRAESIVTSMKSNIQAADLIVVVATPRYVQKDLHNGSEAQGLSEMIHTEVGMAIASHKPVIAFVQEGTEPSGIIPSITQYIVLKNDIEDVRNKIEQIAALLRNVVTVVFNNRQRANSKELSTLITTGLAFVGGAFILDSLFNETKRSK